MSPKTGVCLVDLQCGHIWSGTLSLLLGTPILDENRRRPGWEWPAPQPQRSSGREGPTCGWDWLRSSRSSSRPLKQRPLWWPHKWTDWPRRVNCKEHHVTYFSAHNDVILHSEGVKQEKPGFTNYQPRPKYSWALSKIEVKGKLFWKIWKKFWKIRKISEIF